MTCREAIQSSAALNVQVEGLTEQKEDAWKLFCQDYGKKISYAEKKMLVELTDNKISPKGHLGESHLF
jgi:hypothetical protein